MSPCLLLAHADHQADRQQSEHDKCDGGEVPVSLCAPTDSQDQHPGQRRQHKSKKAQIEQGHSVAGDNQRKQRRNRRRGAFRARLLFDEH